MTDFLTLLYTSFSKIPTLSYNWSLKKLLLLGTTFLYWPLYGVPPAPHPPLPHANNKPWKEIIVNLMLQAFLEHLEVKIIIINAIPGILWKGIVIYLSICDNMTSPKLHVWTVWCKCWTWQRWLCFLKLKSNHSWWNAAKINNIICITTVLLMKWTAENS